MKQDGGEENQIAPKLKNVKQKDRIKKDKEQRQYKEHADSSVQKERYFSVWTVVWLIGMFACISIFSVIYVLCCRQFCTALPVENTLIKEWLLSHKTRRTISIQQSECISTPLAYGFFHPVILMPKTVKWENSG